MRDWSLNARTARYEPRGSDVDYEAALHDFARANHEATLDSINESGDYNDDIEAGLRSAVEDFKATGTW